MDAYRGSSLISNRDFETRWAFLKETRKKENEIVLVLLERKSSETGEGVSKNIKKLLEKRLARTRKMFVALSGGIFLGCSWCGGGLYTSSKWIICS